MMVRFLLDPGPRPRDPGHRRAAATFDDVVARSPSRSTRSAASPRRSTRSRGSHASTRTTPPSSSCSGSSRSRSRRSRRCPTSCASSSERARTRCWPRSTSPASSSATRARTRPPRRWPAARSTRAAPRRAASVIALGGLRARVEVALRAIAAELAQALLLLARLDALGDDRQPDGVGHVDRRLDDRAVVGVAVDAGDERAVDLEHVEREALEVAERRVAGAEVVEHERSARAPGASRGRSPASRPPPSARVSVISSASVPARSPLRSAIAATWAGKQRVERLAPGDVDRHAERRVDVALPGRGLAAGLLEHRAARARRSGRSPRRSG